MFNFENQLIVHVYEFNSSSKIYNLPNTKFMKAACGSSVVTERNFKHTQKDYNDHLSCSKTDFETKFQEQSWQNAILVMVPL